LTDCLFFCKEDPKELLEPAVNGTTGILKAIVRSAPSVRRVVVTSSFAAILDEDKLSDPKTVFSEKTWNPVTAEDAHKNQATAYRASKKLAEKAAWEFVKDPANGVKFVSPPVSPILPCVFR
jgi:nucleoside-diphosphate-sugar epimerase